MSKHENMPPKRMEPLPAPSMSGIFAPFVEYMVDAAQRTVLFWDVMRQRGNQYREHMRRLRRMSWTTRWSSSSTAGPSSGR